MSNCPLVTIVVPIYQIERYVGACIESIIKQTYTNLEIILVDDGSTDRSSELCDLYAIKDERITVIHKKNGGLVSARKTGMKIANGEYATYVDGDDWIEPNYIENMVSNLSDADLVIAGQSRDLFDAVTCIPNNVCGGVYEGETLDELFKNMISYGSFYKPGITTYVWNKLFKKSLLLKHQLLVDDEISIGEDAAVTYPLLMECSKVVVVENYGYHYRQREDSMLKRTKPLQEEILGLKKLYMHMVNFSKKHNSKYNLLGQIQDFILSICFMRSGCIEFDKELILPFEINFKNKKVAIYSAGTFGQQLVGRIKEHNYADIVSWVDVDFWEYRRCCLDVDNIETLFNKNFDYVLIATVNGEQAKKIEDELVSCGISRKKVLSIKLNKNKQELIDKFLA